jgi:hypothetical protein
LLGQVPGFGDIETTYYPARFMEQIAKRPGVTTTRYFENDEGHVTDAVEAGFAVAQ